MRCTGRCLLYILELTSWAMSAYGIQIVDHCLMRLNLDLKPFLEKYHQLYRGKRVEDPSSNERG